MPTPQKEKFDQLTYGSLPSELSHGFSTLVKPTVYHVEKQVSVLKETSSVVYKNIYIDIVDDQSLNALATVSGPDEIIGINAGAGISLQLIFLSLLSHSDVLQ